MDRYPVAGEIIGIEFLFGLSFRDLMETVAIPIAIIMVPRLLNLGGTVTTVTGIFGIFLGLAVLRLKRDTQRPFQYVFGLIDFYLTPNTYTKQRTRDTDLGDHQEVPLTLVDSSKTRPQQMERDEIDE